MTKAAVFTMKLEPELRDAFIAEASRQDRPASQVVRELMRSYIEQHRQTRAYNEFLQARVDAGRASMRAGRGKTNADIEAKFAEKRQKLASEMK